MIPDDVFKVTQYLRRYHKSEEKIPDKSKTRVLESLARSIRGNPPLPKGPCQLCETVADKLVPIPLKVCKPCVLLFIKKSNNLRFLSVEYTDFYCDYCLGRGFSSYSINPWLDKKCMTKIGNKHKFGIQRMKQEMARVAQRGY